MTKKKMAAHPAKQKYLEGLKPRRKTVGLTQEALGALIGTTKESIRAWESGLYWPSASFLPGMAKALGCKIEDLYRAPETEAADEQK